MGTNTETKPGVQTTEFWMHAVLQVLLLLNTLNVWSYMPQKYTVLVQGILGAAYALGRGVAKTGVPNATTSNPPDDGVN